VCVCVCLSVCLSLIVDNIHALCVFSLCSACAAHFTLASLVSVFSQLRSRSLESGEGAEQLAGALEEEPGVGGGGGVVEGRRANKEGSSQGGGEVDTGEEHQPDLVETQEDSGQRSISEIDLR